MLIWQTFFSSKGRIGRGRYWAVICILFAAALTVDLVTAVVMNRAFPYVVFAVALLNLVAGLNNQIKRMHDLGLSGWWLAPPIALILVLAAIGAASGVDDETGGASGLASLYMLVLFGLTVVLGTLPGQPVDNRFGPAPIDLSPDEDELLD